MENTTAYIIAAGIGSRLAEENCGIKKSMVPICGEPMLGRLIRLLDEAGFTSIRIITNEANADVADYVRAKAAELHSAKPDIFLKSTAGSMMSLFELLSRKNDYPFFLFTVDTVFRTDEFRNYVAYCKEHSDAYDSIIAVTGFIDDEKPLYVRTEGSRITAFCDEQFDCTKITCGMYWFGGNVLPLLEKNISQQKTRMRDFQRSLVTSGQKVGYYTFSKTIDVDHITDIAKAEQFINEEKAAK